MNAQRAKAVLAQARAEGRSALSEVQAKEVLAAFGISVPRGQFLPPCPDICVAGQLRPPFALKVVAPDVLHKTEAGGVCLNLADDAAVAEELVAMGARIAAAGHPVEGWLLEEMAPRGVEMVVGGLHDARFGPVVMCGIGGVLVELLQDISFAICPIDAADCDAMLATLRGRALLEGWRGAPPCAIESLHRTLLSIGGSGGILETLGSELAELDINPLIVSSTGAVAADARILLGSPK